MSYILEALKKSQAERELGRVPTLDGIGLFAEDKLDPPRSPWALVSVGLAVTAVLIALYAALRQPPVAVPLAGSSPATPAAVALPTAPLKEGGAPTALQLPAPIAVAAPTVVNPGAGADQTAAVAPPTPGPSGGTLTLVPAVPAAPLIEAPPPKGGARPPSPAVGPTAPELSVSVPPEVEAAVAVASDAELELELQRQLEAEPVTAQDAEEWIDVPPEEPVPTPIPPDLIADIESFKHQRQQRLAPEKEGQGPTKSPSAAPPKPPVPSVTARFGEDPAALRLTRDQQATLPTFMMSVHVYEADQSRRFVLINGLKYRDGDKTREGLTVEQILADGAVLSFQGNPFFVHR